MDDEKFINNVAEIIKGGIKTVEEVEGDKIYSRPLIKKIATKIKSSPQIVRLKVKKKASALLEKLKLLFEKKKVNDEKKKSVNGTCNAGELEKHHENLDDSSANSKNSLTHNLSNACASDNMQESDIQEQKSFHTYDVDCLEYDEVTDGRNLYKTIPIDGDGNCLFRCFSQYLFGTQLLHRELREETVDYVVKNFDKEYDALVLSNPFREYKNVERYDQIMRRIGEYGTLFEAGILRKIYNLNIRVFTGDRYSKYIEKRDECIDGRNEELVNLLITGIKKGIEIDEGHWVVLEKLEPDSEKWLKSHNFNSATTASDKSLRIETTPISQTLHGKVSPERMSEVGEKNNMTEHTTENTSSSDFESPLQANEDLLKLCEKAERSGEKQVKTVYSHDLGLISLPSAAFKNALGYRYPDKVRAIIEDCLLHDLNCTCTLQFYGGVRKNALDFVAYAKCGHVTHKARFKFRMHHMDETIAYIHVMSTEEIKFVHENTIESTRYKPLKNQQRDVFVEKAEAQGVQNFLDEIINTSDRGLKSDGHMQEIRRSTVLYTAISQKNSKNRLRLESKDLLDLYEMAIQESKKKDPFLRSVSFPIRVIMFTEEDIVMASTESIIIVHIDATGSIARIPQYIHCKKLYLYTIVMRHKNGIIKLAYMITSEHDISSVGNWLLAFKHFTMKVLKKWPLMRALVSDWSWVFFHSAMEQWNSITLKKYNEIMFDYAVKGIDPPPDLIILKICCSHFINLVSRTIKANFSHFVVKKYENKKVLTEERKKQIKNVLLDYIGLLILCRNSTEVDEVFSNICKVLLTPEKEDASEAMIALGSFMTKHSRELQEQDNNLSDELNDEKIETKSTEKMYAKVMYKESPFYDRYSAKYYSENDKVKKKLYDKDIMNDPTNIYFAPKFVIHLVTTWMPYVHLWTGIGLDLIDPTISRVSNAYVESSTKVTKKVLDNHANSSIGDVVRKLETDRQRMAGVIQMDVHVKKAKASIAKPKYPKHISNPNLTETWDPTTSEDYTIEVKKSKPSHLNANTIKNEIKDLNKAKSLEASISSNALKKDKTRKLNKQKRVTFEKDGDSIKSIGKSTNKRKSTTVASEVKNKKMKNEVFDVQNNQEQKKAKRKRSLSRKDENTTNKCKKIKRMLLSESRKDNEEQKKAKRKRSLSREETNKRKKIKRTLLSESRKDNGCDKEISASCDVNIVEQEEINLSSVIHVESKDDKIADPVILIEDSSEEELERQSSHVAADIDRNKNDGVESTSQCEQECEKKIQWLQTNLEQYPNGMVKDVNYYLNSRSTNILVSCYDAPKFISTKKCHLRAREFSTLKENIWVNGLVIDSFVATHINEWPDVTYITTDDTIMILGDESHRRISKNRKICKVEFHLKNLVLMPYLYNSHWRLVAVNIKEQKICLLDPYGDDSDYTRVFEVFQKFIMYSDSSFKILKNIKWKKWLIKDRPYQLFNDGSSCGVYLMHYAVCLGYNKPFYKKLVISDYRKVISNRLLLLSNNMYNACLHCGSAIKLAFVTCHGCFRKCEEKCLIYSNVDTDTEDTKSSKGLINKKITKCSNKITTIKGKFICRLCKKYCTE